MKSKTIWITTLFFILLGNFLLSFATNYPHNICEDPEYPENGYRIGDSFNVGDSVSFGCDDKFDLYGSNVITCEADAFESYWSDDTPVCIPELDERTKKTRRKERTRPCGKEPPRGSHARKLRSSTKLILEYECENDHDFIEVCGDRFVYCYEKQWQGTPLECRRREQCMKEMVSDSTGYEMSGTREEDKVNFFCDDGFVLNGPSQVTCLSTGEWSDNWSNCEKMDCGTPPDVANSNPVYQSSESTLYQSTVQYTCNTGYRRSGSGSVICQANGEWSQPPRCDLITCPYPPAVINGQFKLNDINIGSVASYRCILGYVLNGVDSLTCSPNGKWSPAAPTCKPVDCLSLRDPTNGRVQVSATTYNSIAYYFCNNGYNLVGQQNRKCQYDGTWYGDPPICESKECPLLSDPQNGLVDAPSYTVRSIARYSCQTGYELVGMKERQCLTSAKWSGSPPSCIIVNCGSLQNPIGGVVTVSTTTFNSTATYMCNNDRVLIGEDSRQCQSDKTWSGNSPMCVLTTSIDCDSLSPPANGEVFFTTTFSGSTAEYSCNEGFNISGIQTRTCLVNAEWSDEAPTCVEIICHYPPEIENGNVTFTSTNFNSIATYTCNERFSLSTNNDILTCQEEGVWIGELPACIVDCGLLESPNNVTIITYNNNNTLLHSTVQYSCFPGYFVMGNDERVCQENGTWSGEEPVCVFSPVDCGLLESPNNVTIITYNNNNTLLHSTVQYSCFPGYFVMGDDERVCQENGTWSGEEPVCVSAPVDCGPLESPNNVTIITYNNNNTLLHSTVQYSCFPGYFVMGDDERVCQENGTWSGQEPVCEPVDCGPLEQPLNGVLRIFGTTLANPARYDCNVGFQIVGFNIRICLENGSWSGTAPRCEIIDCGVLEDPINGRVEFDSTTFTSVARYSCISEYMLQGPAERFCRDDGMWGGEEPICQLIDCGHPGTPKNGILDIGSTLLNDIVRYDCVTGYRLVGEDTRTCQNNGEWSGEDPRCNIVDCGDPGRVINGRRSLFGTTFNNGFVTFSCISGFQIQGDSSRRCEANGRWSGRLPSCTGSGPNCGLPGTPTNGDVIIIDTIPESEVRYTCNDGFELIGNERRRCGNNEKWNGRVPECHRISRCPDLEVPEFSRKIGDNRTIGSVMYFICNDDYDIDGSNARMCQSNGEWSGTQPTCIERNTSCIENGSVNDSVGRQCDCINGTLVNCCRYRQDWLDLSNEQKTEYIDAVKTVSSDPLYQPLYQTLMRKYDDSSQTIAQSLDTSDTQFLPWHRYFLHQYEDLLRMINPTVYIPYWDWTLLPQTPYQNPVFSSQTGFGNSSDENSCVDSGPFRKGKFSLTQVSGGGCLERLYGPGSLLTRQQLEDIILVRSASQFSQFFSFLTIPYLSVRCTIGGTICSLETATPTEEPLHILILSFLDSIWDRWQGFSPERRLARYGTDESTLFMTDGVIVRDYHDNRNLPYGASVCYGQPRNDISGGEGKQKRSVEEEDVVCFSEEWMDKLLLTEDQRTFITAICRLFYVYSTK